MLFGAAGESSRPDLRMVPASAAAQQLSMFVSVCLRCCVLHAACKSNGGTTYGAAQRCSSMFALCKLQPVLLLLLA
jgi:hypothetical protein